VAKLFKMSVSVFKYFCLIVTNFLLKISLDKKLVSFFILICDQTGFEPTNLQWRTTKPPPCNIKQKNFCLNGS